MRILRAAGHRTMPWKNGGGTTTEIAAHPPGADLAGFGWRVSMATVAADGPFSLFPGIDRTLALLDGDGMDLAIEGLGEHRLTVASDPLPFPADVAASARLRGGPILDLNTMTRRGAHRHAVERLPAGTTADLAFTAGWTLILARGPTRLAMRDGTAVALERDDAALAERGDPPAVLSATAEAYLVRIDPA